MNIVFEVYKLTNSLPEEEKYGLKSQMNRACISIPSNIAEGCSRKSNRVFKSFLEIALGSAFELETQLLIVLKLNIFSKNEIENILQLLGNEQRMINGMIGTLKID